VTGQAVRECDQPGGVVERCLGVQRPDLDRAKPRMRAQLPPKLAVVSYGFDRQAVGRCVKWSSDTGYDRDLVLEFVHRTNYVAGGPDGRGLVRRHN
jgi:hypothetical protein